MEPIPIFRTKFSIIEVEEMGNNKYRLTLSPYTFHLKFCPPGLDFKREVFRTAWENNLIPKGWYSKFRIWLPNKSLKDFKIEAARVGESHTFEEYLKESRAKRRRD